MGNHLPIKHFYTDTLHRKIYATDASVYRKIPYAVSYPETVEDIIQIIEYAKEKGMSITPRGAGTSLGGQCVTDGIVVDMSKFFTKIIDLDVKAKTVWVQPGVIRDQLNDYLKPFGLFFSPNTSTTNRCTIGGMLGNNSSGTTSIQYGVTRDKVLEIKTVLSDGSQVIFKSVSNQEVLEKQKLKTLEGKVYKVLFEELSRQEVQDEIESQFPQKTIHRRNSGYALDSLIDTTLFTDSTTPFNVCKLLAGSEGTLAFTTEIKLHLDVLPPKNSVLVAAHFDSLSQAMNAVPIAMTQKLYMCELMDKVILDQTKSNRTQAENRRFIVGDPKAILLLEVAAETLDQAKNQADELIKLLENNKMGYAFPMMFGNDLTKATKLRSAGLGLLGNIVGDNKAVACIEDTAVALEDLPKYIEDFNEVMKPFDQDFVYYAHAGAGELHLRPILNLKKSIDVQLFKEITEQVAVLVKKYKGSLSGEHGDGIVRASFLPFMVGEKNYALFKKIKQTFDPDNIFNKGKIVDAEPIEKDLRYVADREEPVIETIYNFSDSLGILRATEKCNGSGDCRKLPASGGTMCPSYRATRNEKDSTRARANALREFLTNSDQPNMFNHKELYDVFDLCLSCKACASECPSNVDVATLKAEFLYQYQKVNGVPFRSKLFAYNATLNKLGAVLPSVSNFLLNKKVTKKLLGIASKRSIPELSSITFSKWLKQQPDQTESNKGNLILFVDEYTNFYDVEMGQDAYKLLTKLGYKVLIVPHAESGRSYISKGLLDKAKEIANENIAIFKDIVSQEMPLVGLEPSTILSFKDEYIRLADSEEAAKELAKHVYTIDGFFQREIEALRISSKDFTTISRKIEIHGHCHQKSIEGSEGLKVMLSLPENYSVNVMDTGCCGMAGSFGYEAEHYTISMQVGEDSLFPKLREMDAETVCVAAGTSCRHQIKDGVNKKALHPVSILLKALK
jgi:FAD/FMN-containing dehydrogenase/Fe-S oxidoreductase